MVRVASCHMETPGEDEFKATLEKLDGSTEAVEAEVKKARIGRFLGKPWGEKMMAFSAICFLNLQK